MTPQVSGPAPAPPAELADLLAASSSAAREEAWARFARVHTPLILRVSRSLGGDADAAMDRYAHALERLREDDCRRLRAYVRPGAGEFTLWLIVVVRRLCLDHYRERYGRAAPGGRDPAPGATRAGRRRLVDLVADRTDPALLASPSRSPDDELTRRERLDALASALERLGPTDRLLLRLRYAEELPAREIAKIMRLPSLFHVYRRLDKVLRELRGTLGRLGIEEPGS